MCAIGSTVGASYSGIITCHRKHWSGRLIVALYALRVRETRVRFSAPRPVLSKIDSVRAYSIYRCTAPMRVPCLPAGRDSRRPDTVSEHKNGPVAQLVERVIRIDEVGDSSSPGSTNTKNVCTAADFFGLWRTEACFCSNKNSRVRVVEFFVRRHKKYP